MRTYRCTFSLTSGICNAEIEREGKKGPTFLGTCPACGYLTVFTAK